jgi:hypothetical protein
MTNSRPFRASPAGRTATSVLAGLAIFAVAGHWTFLDAQTLLSAGGLGVPSGAADAQTRAMGGVGIGLRGAHFVPSDPASAAWARIQGISASMEASTESFPGEETTGSTRFPSFGIVYPYGRFVYSVGYSSFLSQEWRTELSRQVEFGEGETVETLDLFEASGGIGQLHLGVSRRIREALAVGVNVGTYLGPVERRFERRLDPAQVGQDVEFFQAGGRWRAEGTSATASVSWQPGSQLRVGAGATWAGNLTLQPVDGTRGEPVEVPLPMEFRAGVHAILAPDLTAALSVSTADWSEAALAFEDATSPGRVNRWGAASEWAGSRLLSRRVPISIGYRGADLPFSFLGEAASERAWVGGIGMHLSESDGVPTALVNVGLEQGSRTAGARSESFFRTTVTFRISGR